MHNLFLKIPSLNIINSISKPIFITDIIGKIIYFNKSASELFGWTEKDTIGQEIFNKYISIKDTLDYDVIIQSVLNGNNWEGECKLNSSSEFLISAKLTNSTLYDNDNNIVGILGLIDVIANHESNITDSPFFIENSNVLLIINPKTGKIYDANKSAVNFYGYSYNQLTSLYLWQIDTISKSEILAAIQKNNIGEQNRFISKHQLSNGEIKDIEIICSRIIIEGEEYIYSIIYDITDQIQIDKSLQRSANQYKKLFSEMTSAFALHQMLFDGKGKPIDYRFIEVNEKFEEATGLVAEQIIGRTVKEVLPATEQFWIDTYGEVVKSGISKKFEHFTKAINKFYEVSVYSPEPGYFATIFNDITPQKLEENLLKEREERYKSLYLISPLAYQSLDAEGKIIVVNPTWLNFLGYESSEVLGKDFKEFLADDYVLDFKNAYQIFKENGILSKYQVKLKKKDNTLAFVEFEGRIDYTSLGKFKQSHFSFKDISEQMVLQSKLSACELSLKSARESANIGSWTYNFKTKVAICSDEWFKIFGLTPQEFMPTIDELLKRIHPEDINKDIEAFEYAIKNNTIYNSEKRIIRPDGEIRYVISRGIPIYDEDSNPISISGSLWDTTEQKLVENELFKINDELLKANSIIELNNQRLESLLRISQYKYTNSQEFLSYALEELIQLTESKIGLIYFYNELTQEIKIISWSESVDNMCKMMEKPESFQLVNTGCWTQSIRNRKPYIINDYLKEHPISKRLPKGHIPIKTFLSVPIFDEDAIVMIIALANKDSEYLEADIKQVQLHIDSVQKILKQKESDDELRIAKEKAEQSDKLKSAFLANVSHEIRTPMNGIIGFSDLICSNLINDEQRKEFALIINNNCFKLLNLINDIMEVSKIQAGEIVIKNDLTNVNDIMLELNSVYKPLAKDKALDFYLYKPLPDNKAEVFIDRSKIQQTLSILLSNAIKFTHHGFIELGYNYLEHNLEFYVKDTGIGIEEENVDLIFERFVQAETSFSRRYEGSGVGLSIAKAFTEKMGGKINIESKVNEGSLFQVLIPVFLKQ